MKYFNNCTLFLLFTILFQIISLNYSNSQDSKTVLVTALSPIIKYSVAEFMNNFNHEIYLYGFKGDSEILINSYGPFETFKVEIKDYDKLRFHSIFEYDELNDARVTKYFQVAENQKFEFFPVPVFKLKGVDIEVSNSTLKRLAGNKLYEVTIKDDVNSSAVEVFPLESSAPYIDVIRIDTVTYQIMLKNKDEFIGNLTDAQIKSWSKGEELSFPIGILMIDRTVPDDEQTYQLYLKKKKKARKKTA